MGFRGRICLYAASIGWIAVLVLAVLVGGVDLAVALRSAGWGLVALGAVALAAALLVALGVGHLQPAIESRRWWAFSIFMEGVGLILFGLNALRPLPPAGDLEARASFSGWGLVLVLMFGAAVIIELWADGRAAPTVKRPFYRPRNLNAPDDDDVFVGPRR
jgi:hypothetical protein